MRAHYLQHVPFEGLGSIEPWLLNSGYEITLTQLHHSEKLPNIGEVDLLVVIGGPMSVHDKQEYPWLAKEKEYIKKGNSFRETHSGNLSWRTAHFRFFGGHCFSESGKRNRLVSGSFGKNRR